MGGDGFAHIVRQPAEVERPEVVLPGAAEEGSPFGIDTHHENNRGTVGP
jgi:hypothetical protein